jgi:hypothetical protein
MNIQTTHIKPYTPNYKPLAKAHAQNNEAALQGPKDEFTFSGKDMFPFLGMGVMFTGIMVGAQMGSPAVMIGSMFGGMALMVAGD